MGDMQKINDLKKELDSIRPLTPESLIELKGFFNIDFIYNSNALEGNTLTLSETQVVIEDGLTISGKPLKDHYEASGGHEAYEKMFSLIKGDLFSEDQVLDIHRAFYHRIDPEFAGVYRDRPVIITGAKHIPPAPEKIKNLMGDYIAKLKENENEDPLKLAALAHNEFITIHPFIDGNGRTARILFNLILIQKGHLPTVIPSVLRSDYISACSKGNEGIHQPFIDLLGRMLIETYKDLIRALKKSNN